ncbi:MAG: bifunctional methylenetetrahydrofolate dehydrogenase/methenyltetrahydrofolate cyclohydrolase [Holosporaceae bacterium]|nr:bifunctional methylenetetrahydrofolate dehydrogenase/methenyltetrahydrofolate cyclohydrolase [Holosporaceae bacterium]
MIIDGKKIAAEFRERLKERATSLKRRGIEPSIALINAGNDPASAIYVSNKQKLAAEIGIASTVYKFDDDVKGNELANLIKKLNADKNVHAILLQSPLPKNLRFSEFVNLIDPNKDVDGLTLVNQGKLFAGEPNVIPCTPFGVLHLLQTVREDISGAYAVVLGRSLIVGRPLAQLLLNNNCTVAIAHSRSKNVPEICKTADILIAAVGKPRLVGKEFVKPGAIVIDVGINRILGSKKIVGDVNFDEVREVAGAITPVPGGVGPMTVAYLMSNALDLAYRHAGI